MEAKYDELRAMGAEVVAVSADSHYSHRAFSKAKGFRFPLLSDHGNDVAARIAGTYESVGPYRDVNRRRMLVIDRDMVVRWEWTAPDAGVIPDTEAVREAVQEVVYG